MEPESKMRKVTFSHGLPLGTRATFEHDGQTWIAYPEKKDKSIRAVIDRLLGIYNRIDREMLLWINQWPDDGVRVVSVMDHSRRAKALVAELVTDKAKAWTS